MIINYLIFALTENYHLYQPYFSFLHNLNPVKRYYIAMLGNGLKEEDAIYADDFISSGFLLCILYLVLRVLVEISKRQTKLSKKHVVWTSITALVFCCIIFNWENIDRNISPFRLSIYHPMTQNIFTINFLSACLAGIVGEIFAQIIAYIGTGKQIEA